MRVIWNGVATSATRVDRASGQPLSYRLVAYDTGEASCTCPGFLFGGIRNPRIADRDRLRVRCTHLVAAYATGQIPDQADQADQASAEPLAPVGRPPTADPRAARLATIAADDLYDEDDDLPNVPHRVR